MVLKGRKTFGQYFIFRMDIRIVKCIIGFLFLSSCGQDNGSKVQEGSHETSHNKRIILEVNANELEKPLDSNVLVILGARVIDGIGNVYIENSCVIIEGNIIKWVGNKQDAVIPEKAEFFDASGLTLLPGLIDPHFHYDNVKYFPTLFLRNGVTSVRDPGQWIEAYDFERNTGEPLPRLFLTGPHLESFPSAFPKDAYIVRDKEEVRTGIEILANQGVSAIKIYYRLPLGLIKETCMEAHKYGLPVTAHLEITDAKQAILAGLDGVEHISSFGTALTPLRIAEKYRHLLMGDISRRNKDSETNKLWAAVDLNNALADSLVPFLSKQGTFVTPTLGALQVKEEEKDSIGYRAFQNMKGFVEKCYKGGVNIVVGSHGPWVRYAKKGWSYQHEMELLVESGMLPMDVIVASTSKSAKFLAISDRLGSIEHGKQADLIFVKGNPLEDIKAMYNVEKVLLNGVWVSQ